MQNNRRKGYKTGFFFLAGIITLFVPLLGDFHIESAMLVSVVGSFWAAIHACYYREVAGEYEIWQPLRILGYGYIFGLPLFLFAVLSGCFSLQGLGFWFLYPVPAVFLSYALGRLLRKWQFPFRRTVAILILLFLSIGVWAYEFFHFPQVYFFNQIWGGWPGPIYDETITISWSLVAFRFITGAWAGLLWWLPAVRHQLKAKIITVGCLLVLVVGYSLLPQLGIITPRHDIQQQLGGRKETPHFILYYDKAHYSQKEVAFLAQRHEFFYRQIIDTLELKNPEPNGKIESFLYAHPWQKKKLVGAKFTSYVPIWLARDQLHIAKQQITRSLKHELVHVLAKRFGNDLFNGSWSIGLIEGLAVAVAPGESPLSTIDQMVVSEKPYPGAREMRKALSPLGFYGGRSAVNYIQSGSFVQYLLKHYPVDRFKKAYQTGHLSRAYDVSLGTLVQQWHRRLDSISVDSTDRKIAARLYGMPSLFEQPCPHVQSAFAQTWDRYRYYMAEKDTAHALTFLGRARREAPENDYVKNSWAFLNLKTGHSREVRQQASLRDTTVDGLLLYADAFALAGKTETANEYVAASGPLMKAKQDSSTIEAVALRKNAQQWRWYRQLMYEHRQARDSLFKKLNTKTQARVMAMRLKKKQGQEVADLARIALHQRASAIYFNTYNKLIVWLAFDHHAGLAQKWLQKLKTLHLRPRYTERLRETAGWIDFEKHWKQSERVVVK